MKRKRRFAAAALSILLTVLMSAILLGSDPAASAESGVLKLEEHSFTVQQWKADGSHIATVKGQLLYGGKPVVGAIVQAGANQKQIETANDGSFTFMVDKSIIAEKQLKVISLDKARVDGKPVDQKAARELMSLAATYQVYFPIEVTQVEDALTKPGHAAVHARLIFPAGEVFSFFRVDKYRISGKVTDADGKPVRGAVVWLDRDNGEGFAKSTPTDENGEYQLFYVPEYEETNLTVTIGRERYTLPQGKVMKIPKGTSVSIDIRLPREGNVISPQPPDLVTSVMDGALYTGIMPGLDVPPGVEYTVTIPDHEGRFVITVPKEVWDSQPTFFETNLTKFIGQKEVLREGDPLPSGMLEPGAQEPRKIKAKISA
jgi:hypothetical protein